MRKHTHSHTHTMQWHLEAKHPKGNVTLTVSGTRALPFSPGLLKGNGVPRCLPGTCCEVGAPLLLTP